jgi:hypothetical protein
MRMHLGLFFQCGISLCLGTMVCLGAEHFVAVFANGSSTSAAANFILPVPQAVNDMDHNRRFCRVEIKKNKILFFI